MKKSVKRVAARVVPTNLRGKLRGTTGSSQAPADGFPTTASMPHVAGMAGLPSTTAPATDATVVVPWSVAGVERVDGAWQIAAHLPAGSVFQKLTLVLAGRTNERRVRIPADGSGSTMTAQVRDDDLRQYLGDIVDVWIEPVTGDVIGTWRRLGGEPDAATTGRTIAAEGDVQWYSTAKRNVSVRVRSAANETSSSTGPRVETLGASEDRADLRIVELPEGSAALVLVGATTKKTVEIDLDAGVTHGVVTVVDDDLRIFGAEVVHLYVSGEADELASRTLHRLWVSAEAMGSAEASGRNRWFATPTGKAAVQRKTPVELIADSGVFDEAYYRRQVPDLPAESDAIEHYVTTGAKQGVNPSTMFDTAHYRRTNPDVRGNGLLHYIQWGWRELRNPSPSFDTWWYWSKHLDLASTDVNPLAHYETVGKKEGLSTRPSLHPSRSLGEGHRLPAGSPVRRICLFAGYDADGLVDDYVVAYVRELSRYADVYYWADSPMLDSELAKLSGITVDARAERHGEYDFGSYARLVEAIGWEKIEEYDELLLVNDSCYLLRPLDEVFERMDARPSDWWGLQATKGIAQTRRAATNLFREPIAIESVRNALVDAFERDSIYDFLVGSYFLAYRQPVIRDPEFRRYFGTITGQPDKRSIIKKYEIGLTRWLLQHGHQLDTYVSKLYPFHPIFTEWYFRLLDEGFPLLKRFFLTENHYFVPDLWRWEERVLAKVPGADVPAFRRNLERVASPERLRRTLGARSEDDLSVLAVPDTLMSRQEFIEADRNSPKDPTWWVFPVCGYTGQFSGNERAIFEAVKDDASIRKIILTRDVPVDVTGTNVEILPLESPVGQHRLIHSANILIKHSVAVNVGYPVSSDRHNLIQVWHGIPFKRIGYASSDFLGRLEPAAEENAEFRAVISSSKVDTLAMTAAFYPLTVHQVWNTGLPRNDFILRDEQALPADLLASLEKLRAELAGRRLVLLMPTFRNAQSNAYYRFTDAQIEDLGTWLTANNAVLGIREHMADKARTYSSQLSEIPVVDLSEAAFPDVEILYRESIGLITDYSSCFIDYMLTGKPAVSFAYDYDAYLMERGGFYDLDMVFPGPICQSFDELRKALDGLVAGEVDPSYALKRRLMFDHIDDQNASRVVERMRDLTEVRGVGKPINERMS